MTDSMFHFVVGGVAFALLFFFRRLLNSSALVGEIEERELEI